MQDQFQARLQTVDVALLAPLVQQALDNPRAEVLEWQLRPLLGGMETEETGVLGRIRFFGHARLQDEVVPWALVLKAFIPPLVRAHKQGESSPLDWKREALLYQSGLLRELQGGLVAPRYYAVTEYSDEQVWVWMEYVVEEPRQWTLPRFGLAAKHLGHFNGQSLVQKTAPTYPTYPWLNHHFIQQWLMMTEPDEKELLRLAQSPHSWVTPQNIERILRLYERSKSLVEALEQLPQCLCHHDAHRRNLMARRTGVGEEQTVAIDWAVAGPGAVGEEIAILVTFTLSPLLVTVGDAPKLEAEVYAGYLAGLREAGWRGEEKMVRLGYTLALTLFNTAIYNFLLRRLEDGESFSRAVENDIGQPFSVIAHQWRNNLEYGLDRGDEAFTLL